MHGLVQPSGLLRPGSVKRLGAADARALGRTAHRSRRAHREETKEGGIKLSAHSGALTALPGKQPGRAFPRLGLCRMDISHRSVAVRARQTGKGHPKLPKLLTTARCSKCYGSWQVVRHIRGQTRMRRRYRCNCAACARSACPSAPMSGMAARTAWLALGRRRRRRRRRWMASPTWASRWRQRSPQRIEHHLKCRISSFLRIDESTYRPRWRRST